MYAAVDSHAGQTAGPRSAGGPAPDDPPVEPDLSERGPVPDESGAGPWPLAHRPEAAGDARRIAREVLEGWEVPEDAGEAAVLVVSELVTNAVEHAEAPVVLHLHRENADGQVWVGVTDGGPAEQDGSWTRSCTGDEHGRGLAMVEALCEAHGSRCHEDGGVTTHWARMHCA